MGSLGDQCIELGDEAPAHARRSAQMKTAELRDHLAGFDGAVATGRTRPNACSSSRRKARHRPDVPRRGDHERLAVGANEAERPHEIRPPSPRSHEPRPAILRRLPPAASSTLGRSCQPSGSFVARIRLFSEKGARFLGAAVAFYALLSAAPLFLLVLRIAGAIVGRPRAESALWSRTWPVARARRPRERAPADRAPRRRAPLGELPRGLLVVYGSTRLFRALRRAVNHLWGIDLEGIEKQRDRAARYGLRYGGAFVLALFVVVLVLLLVVEKSAFAIVASFRGCAARSDRLARRPRPRRSASPSSSLPSLFRALPETEVTWREAATSSLVSTVLFAVGSTAVTAYIRHKHLSDLYASASTILVAVLWVYYSTQVFFLGACIAATLRGAADGDAR